MRICILANALAVHTQRWARALSARGHEVTVVSIRWAEIPGVRVITKAVGPVNSTRRICSLLSYLRLALSARSLLSGLAPDVVNAHYCITHGSIARFARVRPIVVNLWGSDVLWTRGGKAPTWFATLVRYSLAKADTIVSTSRFMAATANKHLSSHREITVVPFGVDTTRFTPSAPPEQRPSHGQRTIRVGFVKTFQEVYAPEVFLQAAAVAAGRNGAMHFVMAGRGPLLDCCIELASDLGIADRVEFPGFVPHDELPALMRSLDILVNCSRSESFGVVICEGAACELPVVATDVGGVRETLIGGETGILVQKDDVNAIAEAMIELAGDADLRKRYGKAGRRMVEEHYEWRRNVAQFEAALLREVKK